MGSESIAITAGIAFVGFVLQIAVSDFNFYLLTSPVNLIVGAFDCRLLLVDSCPCKNKIPKVVYERPLLGLPYLGLTYSDPHNGTYPQTGPSSANVKKDIISLLGFNNMTGSWPLS